MVDDIKQLVALFFLRDHPKRADGGTQRGKRVLDLMRDIGGELFVRLDPFVKRGHHAAHGARQAPDLVRPRGQVGDADPVGGHLAGVLVAPQFRRGGKVRKRVGDGGGQHQRQADGDDDRDHEHLQHLLALHPDKLVDLPRDRGHGGDADDGGPLPDRGRDGKDRLARGIVSCPDLGLPGQRAGDEVAGQILGRVARIDGAFGGQQACDAFPDLRQHVGDEGGAAVALQAQHRLGLWPVHADGGDHKAFGRVEDEQLRPFGQFDRHRGADRVDPVRGGKIHRPLDGQLRLEHVGDQLRLGHKAAFALQNKAVAERVEVQHARDKDDHRQKVEGDDLAGQRRAVERDEPALLAPGPQFGIDDAFGGRPVLTEDDVRTPVSRFLAAQVDSRDQGHSSL